MEWYREERLVSVAADDAALEGDLTLPDGARGAILFAVDTGRYAPENRRAAREFLDAKFATLLIDLLTEEETDLRPLVDLDFLSRRLIAATDWLSLNPDTRELRVGLFGGDAALRAAAARPEAVDAVVWRGQDPPPGEVEVPTLYLVDSGAPEVTARLARAWFQRHLAR